VTFAVKLPSDRIVRVAIAALAFLVWSANAAVHAQRSHPTSTSSGTPPAISALLTIRR
jgi:hypothetical protein